MRIGILGPLQVAGGGLDGPRLRALLVRLALDPGRVVTAERLAEDLWPGEPPEHPLAALQSLVSRARRKAPGLIASHPVGYVLDVPRSEVDAWEFERLVRAGEHRAALALWRGPALADASGWPFAHAPSARLAELRLQALAASIEPGPQAVAQLEELVAEHPLREPFHALLVRALAAGGRRGEALDAYDRIRRTLAEELGADPGPELREAHLFALREEAAGNLPAPLTSFVGREAEVATLRGLLERARLVTLTGPGGAGKTRLAIETAATLPAPDGAWLVELASATDVRAALQATLKVGDLEGTLRGASTLIVLDNCEHVIDQAARMAERLLSQAPRLRIIATSREPLDVPGEHLHPVGPLAQEHAVRLFRERAAAARPGLALEEDRVAALCRRLDGLPLAVELAAARLRTLSPDQLAAQIEDRLSWRGSRTSQPRHRTLRAVIGWSWDLLASAERDLLARMSVFAGGARAEAVLEVCGHDLETLSSLVDKSLVAVSGERYTMLETVREYAAGHRPPGVEAAHARYYTRLAERADPGLRTAGQRRWLAVFDAEQANLDAAMAAAEEPERLFLARLWPWVMRGMRAEAGTWARFVLGRGPAGALCRLIAGDGSAVPEGDGPAEMAAWMLAPGGLGSPDQALARGRAAAAVERPGPWTRAAARLMGGIVEFEYGTAAPAEPMLRAALAGFREIGDRWGTAVALYWLSLAAENRGDAVEALALAEESRRPAAEINGVDALPGPVMLRIRLGQLRARVGDFDGARFELERAQEAAERTRDPLALARVLHGRAELARRAGEPDPELLRRALSLAGEAAGDAPAQFLALVHAELAAALGEPGPIRHALELMEGNPDKTVRAAILEAAAGWCREEDARVLLAAARALRGLGQSVEVPSPEGHAGQPVEMPSPERYALRSLPSPS
ncbi:BTAD domain-containing putative transcriptional regulator [Thermoactinospora rubra]|uniref:BTAD domain-containing putative transcriptional regulator n=1 Tax=Thermoactinospora rubra TaxID=1088767 RepID=UPI000A10E244|nr:BTAD domain-containing putative transcriptional regulator [Thermoactinospora rubra]